MKSTISFKKGGPRSAYLGPSLFVWMKRENNVHMSIWLDVTFNNLCRTITQRAHDVNITSPQRRCNVMTLHRRWDNVIFTSWRCIDVEATLYLRHMPAGHSVWMWKGAENIMPPTHLSPTSKFFKVFLKLGHIAFGSFICLSVWQTEWVLMWL